MEILPKVSREEYREVRDKLKNQLQRRGYIICEVNEKAFISDYHNIQGKLYSYANGIDVFNDQRRIGLTINDTIEQIDHRLAAAIALFNQKGYTTKFCCSGHFSELKLYYYDSGSKKIIVDPYVETPNHYFIANVYEYVSPEIADMRCVSHPYISFDKQIFNNLKVETIFSEFCGRNQMDFEWFSQNFTTIRGHIPSDEIDEMILKITNFARYLPWLEEIELNFPQRIQ